MRQPTTLALTLAALGLGLAACTSGNSNNAAPRLTDIPDQVIAGGAFTLDLMPYASDREGSALTFEVVSGGGSFAGSVYGNTFPTMGGYTVAFGVRDAEGKLTLGSFHVTVTSGQFTVVRQDNSGLLLVDAGTEAVLTVAGSTQPPSLAAGLADGRLVYQLAAGSGTQLWVFDPMTRQNVRVGADLAGDVVYRGRTGDDQLLLTATAGGDSDLYLYEPLSGLLRELSAQAGEADEQPMVSADELVFYQRGSLGQADIYYYDPELGSSTAVSTAATDEQLLAVLPDGAVVFSRVGGSGETDLFWFRRGTGLVEIAGAVTALADLDKSYGGCSSDGKVVFTAANGADRDLYYWNSGDGQTTPIAQGAVYAFGAIAAGNELVYRHEVSGGEHDLFLFDLDDATAATVRNAADVSELLAVTSDGTTAWAIVRRGAAPQNLDAVSLVGAPATVTLAGAAAKELQRVLGNGDVVVRSTDGTAIDVFDVSAGSWSGFTGTGLRCVGDGVDAGDFVFESTAAAQTDLSLWDASATTAVPISAVAGDDTFGAVAAGKVLFTRDVASFTELMVWDPSDLSTEQLTGEDGAGLSHDHLVLGAYDGSR